MQVRNLVSWAGRNFSYQPGDLVDMDDDMAEARIAAGVAELPDKHAGKPVVHVFPKAEKPAK